MEATEAHTRVRPSIQPIWTGYHSLQGQPRSSVPLRSPSFSVSPKSPRTLPSPLHPHAMSVQELAMRKHERAMVDSFDQRTKPSGTTPTVPASSGAIAEQAPGSDARIMSALPLPPPPKFQPYSSPPPTPAMSTGSGGSPPPRRQTIVAETRNILLSGLPQLHARSVGAAVDRRQSQLIKGQPSHAPGSAGRRSSVAIRDQLAAWGHVYLGDAKYADCFVAAVSLRRTSEASKEEVKADGYQSSVDPNRVTIRARVKPRGVERKPFLLQRTFNIDELRATIPEPVPVSATLDKSSMCAEALRRSSSLDVHGQSPALSSDRRFSNGSTGHTPNPGHSPTFNRLVARGNNVVPIHLKYARVHLPILAALMMSGHVREGDVIYLPIPHPEVWTQTVARVYTGQGELTEAVRENILYLAGKV